MPRASAHVIAFAWALVVVGGVVLAVSYGSLPEQVVLYRSPWGAHPTMGPRSVFHVARIAAMGGGQLGAATAMAVAARGHPPWGRFWRWLALVAGAKTALECAGFVATHGGLVERAATASTGALVALFLLAAARWWRKGELRDPPPLGRASGVGLAASLVLWAACAAWPTMGR